MGECGGRASTRVEQIRDAGHRCLWIATARAEFRRIHLLFNDAMNVDFDSAARNTDFLALDPEIFLTSMRTTVLGGLIAAKQALPHMLANGSGSIIFNSSIA